MINGFTQLGGVPVCPAAQVNWQEVLSGGGAHTLPVLLQRPVVPPQLLAVGEVHAAFGVQILQELSGGGVALQVQVVGS